MLYKRLITAGIGAALLVLLLVYGNEVYLASGMFLVSVIALYEFYKATKLWKQKYLCIPGFIAAAFISFGEKLNLTYIMPIMYIYIVLLFVLMLLRHEKTDLRDMALVVLGTLYIPYFLAHITFIRIMEHGAILVWLVFVGAFSTDTFAYFVGRFFGRNKLCPNISPKKTIEGAVGGFLGCGISFIGYGMIINYYFGYHTDMLLLFLIGLICSVLSEIGDLAASLIKRQYEIKDFGNILPGHGGVLDRFDSILFVAPALYLILQSFSKFVILL